MRRRSTMQRTILVIEEEEVLRNGIAAKLRGDGYVVFDLAGGSNAVETVRLHPPSLVVLDVMLTQPDGLEVCRQLRRRPETAKVPILMLVVNEIQSGQLARLQLGVNDYITKPPCGKNCGHAFIRCYAAGAGVQKGT
jgi:DNA-binding response OmpR family regulator